MLVRQLLKRSAQKVAQQPATLLKAVGRDGRLRCSFNPTGTATGRFSSSSPNLQNIGRGAIRSAFTPAPGQCLIVADYSQIELRIAAVVAGDQKMLAAYQAGADLHRETAAAVLEKRWIRRVGREVRRGGGPGCAHLRHGHPLRQLFQSEPP